MKISKSDQAYLSANPGLPPEKLVEDLGGRLTLRQVKAALKKTGPSEAEPAREPGPPKKVALFAVKKGAVVMTEAQAMLGDQVPKRNNQFFNEKYPGCSFDPTKPE